MNASAQSAGSPYVWQQAAARLVSGLQATDDPELRLAMLKRLARRFGELGYPGFLKLLLVVAESDDATARRCVADTLALGLRRMDLPSGQLTSWGGSIAWPALQTFPGGTIGGAHFVNTAPQRQLGPIEYFTVWFCQRTQRPYLGEHAFRDSLTKLISLIDCSREARELYPLKIESDLATGPEGAYTRQARERLGAIVGAWKRGEPPAAVADAAAGPASAGAASAERSRWVLRNL